MEQFLEIHPFVLIQAACVVEKIKSWPKERGMLKIEQEQVFFHTKNAIFFSSFHETRNNSNSSRWYELCEFAPANVDAVGKNGQIRRK